MEMLVNRDILAISIPFSAGVILAAYLPLGELSLYIAAETACIVILLSVGVLIKKNDMRIVMLAFMSVGLFVCWNSFLSISPEALNFKAGKTVLTKLLSHIDNMAFDKEDTASLIKALICGQRDGLSNEIRDAFRSSGASHILALSGLHMGIIYGILSKLLFFFGNSIPGKTARSLIIITSCAFFTLMTSASESVVRAFLFILLNETARLLPGRQRSSLGVFCTALMLQLCISPMSVKSIGFQLSYSAMLGIYLLFPLLESWLPAKAGRIPAIIWKSCALSISCQLFTAPLAYIYFGSFPKMFLLTNMLSLPLTEVFIIFSVLSLGLDGIGCCPDIIKGLTEFLGQTLIYCIETIASIS